jgi:hypothetical protein
MSNKNRLEAVPSVMRATVGRITCISFIASTLVYPETTAADPIVRRATPPRMRDKLRRRRCW